MAGSLSARPRAAQPISIQRQALLQEYSKMISLLRAALVTAPLLATALAAAPSQALAEDAAAYPSRNILLVVPYPPGGPPDVIVRLLGPVLHTILGQPIVIENRPGASTTIGAGAVARAAPDGYTLLASDIAQTVVPNTLANIKFDPARDLKPVSLTARSVLTVVIDPKLPIKSMAELSAYSKTKPDAIKIGHSGIGTPPYLYAVSVMEAADVKALLVPYRGIALAMNDVIAGHIQMACSAPSTTVSLAQSGKVRMLAVSGDRRLAALPDVPTFKELGMRLTGFDQDTWFGISAPKGTPDAIVAKLNAAINKALLDRKVIETLAKVDIRTNGSTPEEFAKLYADQFVTWKAVLQRAGVKAK
jgi:tripartite-type tricarboxylate transporter receptor subunit TctC